jgi:hypothetical protein
VTPPLQTSATRLLLNCSTSAVGSIRVELLGTDGMPLAGRSLGDCQEIYGDELERPVVWKSGVEIPELARTPVRVRVVLRDADLYAFRFAP